MLGQKSIEFGVLFRWQKETPTQTDVLSDYRSVRIDRLPDDPHQCVMDGQHPTKRQNQSDFEWLLGRS